MFIGMTLVLMVELCQGEWMPQREWRSGKLKPIR